MSYSNVRFAIIVLAILSFGQLAYFTYQTREDNTCQQKVNTALLNTFTSRTELVSSDRENDMKAIVAGLNSDSQAERDAVLSTYQRDYAKNTALRDASTYPDIEKLCK